ncbi:MAG TPA: hypothetical protein VHY19_06470 [Steroidobacteraceae bacterium]|jgi:hypothetical protein|nr:hypothetical protein [Steroidobacteraceae bacterium]
MDNSTHGAATPQISAAANPIADLPQHTRAALERAGVKSIADWRALGRRRFGIFGVPAPLIARLDAAARAARR